LSAKKRNKILNGYRVFKVAKKTKGKFRVIYAPLPHKKLELEKLLPRLNQLFFSKEIHDDQGLPVAYAFVPGRNVPQMCQTHLGFRFTESFDLVDFFDNVHVGLMHDVGIPTELLDTVTVRYCDPDTLEAYDKNDKKFKLVAGQGLPTSPVVANIVGTKVDAAVLYFLKKLFGKAATGEPPRFRYTRYADDLSISFNDGGQRDKLIKGIAKVVSEAFLMYREALKLNPEKTRGYDVTKGPRVICGVSLHADGRMSVSRKFRRNTRAAVHKVMLRESGVEAVDYHPQVIEGYTQHVKTSHGNPMSLDSYARVKAGGLVEWSQLKPPSQNCIFSLETNDHEIVDDFTYALKLFRSDALTKSRSLDLTRAIRLSKNRHTRGNVIWENSEYMVIKTQCPVYLLLDDLAFSFHKSTQKGVSGEVIYSHCRSNMWKLFVEGVSSVVLVKKSPDFNLPYLGFCTTLACLNAYEMVSGGRGRSALINAYIPSAGKTLIDAVESLGYSIASRGQIKGSVPERLSVPRDLALITRRGVDGEKHIYLYD
jgi:hypothetical protein